MLYTPVPTDNATVPYFRKFINSQLAVPAFPSNETPPPNTGIALHTATK